MDFMKVFDQTVREIKREVNLKVLKVPEIEQKVLDATNDEPWGPHGTALQEIAQATNRYECQMVMGVLWSRLKDTGPNWRHVYKALTVIEYLIANGSENALDDILEHTYPISAISGFEYVEPNGKDVGINVRKKVETIMNLLNDKEKIQVVREKAASNRDKYTGLSSKGISYKSSSASYGSNSYSSNSSNRYGGFGGSREGESFKDSYSEGDQHGNSHRNKDTHKSHDTSSKLKKGVADNARDQKSPSLKQPSVSSKSSSVPLTDADDDFDDFDPRGTSTSAPAKTSSNQVDLFGESLVSDLLDVPTQSSGAASTTATEADLFADADFQSASPHEDPVAGSNTQVQQNVDLFGDQPVVPPISSNVDFFAAPDASMPSGKANSTTEPTSTGIFDPFASIPLNNFDGSDPFGAFTSHNEPATAEPTQKFTNKSPTSLHETSALDTDFGAFTSHTTQTSSGSQQKTSSSSIDLNPNSLAASKPTVKKETFQVKSGIWADSLSRGLIDLNISAPKKVNLADIGIVGGLDAATEEKEKGVMPQFYIGRSAGAGSGYGMSGAGSGVGMSGFTPSSTTGGFSNLGNQNFGSFK